MPNDNKVSPSPSKSKDGKQSPAPTNDHKASSAFTTPTIVRRTLDTLPESPSSKGMTQRRAQSSTKVSQHMSTTIEHNGDETHKLIPPRQPVSAPKTLLRLKVASAQQVSNNDHVSIDIPTGLFRPVHNSTDNNDHIKELVTKLDQYDQEQQPSTWHEWGDKLNTAINRHKLLTMSVIISSAMTILTFLLYAAAWHVDFTLFPQDEPMTNHTPTEAEKISSVAERANGDRYRLIMSFIVAIGLFSRATMSIIHHSRKPDPLDKENERAESISKKYLYAKTTYCTTRSIYLDDLENSKIDFLKKIYSALGRQLGEGLAINNHMIASEVSAIIEAKSPTKKSVSAWLNSTVALHTKASSVSPSNDSGHESPPTEADLESIESIQEPLNDDTGTIPAEKCAACRALLFKG